MEGKKASLVTSLLAESTSAATPSSGSKPLIQEVNSDAQMLQDAPNKTEEPSLMDLMFAAQQEAKQASDAIKTVERAKESKKFGGGFKKGFLGGSKKVSTKPPSEETKPTLESDPSAIPTIKGQTQHPLVINDVQDAMKEESNPFLQQIKQGEWATPELIDQLRDNPILASGLNNPKCLAALQLLQKDPKEAQQRFQNDPEVSFFLQEFGKVMSSHFFALGNQQQQQGSNSSSVPPPSAPSPSGSKIQEIGPLHAEAISRQKQASLNENERTVVPLAGSQVDSDENVKQVDLFPTLLSH
jgi:hypothetical protein